MEVLGSKQNILNKLRRSGKMSIPYVAFKWQNFLFHELKNSGNDHTSGSWEATAAYLQGNLRCTEGIKPACRPSHWWQGTCPTSGNSIQKRLGDQPSVQGFQLQDKVVIIPGKGRHQQTGLWGNISAELRLVKSNCGLFCGQEGGPWREIMQVKFGLTMLLHHAAYEIPGVALNLKGSLGGRSVMRRRMVHLSPGLSKKPRVAYWFSSLRIWERGCQLSWEPVWIISKLIPSILLCLPEGRTFIVSFIVWKGKSGENIPCTISHFNRHLLKMEQLHLQEKRLF